MRTLFASVLAILLVALGIQPAQATENNIFYSDFNSGWDSRWQIDGNKHNVWVQDGMLVMGLARDPDGKIRQARVDTEDTWQFTFGKVRFRMAFAGPLGAHAAGWLNGDPEYATGQSEVDVAEHAGKPDRIHQALHWCPCPDWPVTQAYSNAVFLNPLEWHTYTVEWDVTGYLFKVDGHVTVGTGLGASPMPHYLILSYLISRYERRYLDVNNLARYRAYVDWVAVSR